MAKGERDREEREKTDHWVGNRGKWNNLRKSGHRVAKRGRKRNKSRVFTG